MDVRQRATLLAALQYWIREGLHSSGHEQDIATGHDRFVALNTFEIEMLVTELELREDI